eukprot:TRINITY_DN12432_c0_g3_i1.p2 TRINITY_DN12432_c0_g3~~TRINITY_DN12432_c0_g3_i1.p2  ORF type:complete len:179 (+),score=59.01 TRINITY_DN12432_c0_g3_i1:106-642(+)
MQDVYAKVIEWAEVHLAKEAKSLVFGGLDGICTSLALMWAGEGTHQESRQILVLGVAGLISQGLSMGMGNLLGGSAEYASAADALWSGAVMCVSFILFGGVPLLACFVPRDVRVFSYFAATVVALFLLGVVRSWLTKERFTRAGLEMVLTGFAAVSISFSISKILARSAKLPEAALPP